MPDHIIDFPEEILILIFQFASTTPVDLIRLSHVCRLFNFLSNQQPFCWQHCPVVFNNLQVGQMYDLGNIERGTSSLLLLKHFDYKSPLFYNNPKYRLVNSSFEKEFRIQEEDRRLKELSQRKPKKDEKRPQNEYQLPAIRKPLIVCKEQYLDELKYLTKNQKKYKRIQQVREYLAGYRSSAEKFFGFALCVILYLIVLFVQLGVAGVHLTSWLPFDSSVSPVFYPLKFLLMFCMGTICVLLFVDQFQKKSESATPPLFGLLLLAFCVYQYINVIENNVTHLVYGGVSNRKLTFWFVMFPPAAMSLFGTVIFYIDNIHKLKIHSYYPWALKSPILKEDFMVMSLGISATLQFLVLASCLEGSSMSLWVVFLLAYIQEIMWSCVLINELRKTTHGRDIEAMGLALSALLGFMWLQTLVSLGVTGAIVFTPLTLSATYFGWIGLRDNVFNYY